MFKTYEETLSFLYDNLPMFQRVGAAALKFNLDNTLALCEALGNPHQRFKTIHIAGTNGKGSTSHMMASILQQAGYKTGLYTSPHLKSFTERIKIDGTDIQSNEVINFVNRIHSLINQIKPSFFEITVAMAFDHFAKHSVDVAVIEVGLGGRLDSTNVITPELSVITNIGWDHMDLLGDTLEKIAAEKAGIIKKNVPVVISERQDAVDDVFVSKADALGAPIYFAPDQFSAVPHNIDGIEALDIYEGKELLLENLILPLQGIYQRRNVLGVMQSVKVLKAKGWKFSLQHVRSGFEGVVFQTGLKGRWQILEKHPMIVCDTGHNLNGIKAVLEQISQQRFRALFVVFGMVKGKDLSAILDLLPRTAYYFFCQPDIPRALGALELYEQAQKHYLIGEVVLNVNEAIRAAKERASDDDMIFIGGSTYVVAEIENL